jgi:hypothetical protein
VTVICLLPYLFLSVADGMSELINKKVQVGALLRGLQIWHLASTVLSAGHITLLDGGHHGCQVNKH